MSDGTDSLPATPQFPAWDRSVERWLTRFKPSTEAAYRRALHRWTTWCTRNAIDPWLAKRGDVESFLADLSRTGLAEATVALTYDGVRSLYDHLYGDEIIAKSPVERVKRPVIHREGQTRTWLTPLEYAAFLTAARAMGPDAHAVAAIGGMMGLRSDEMCQLNVGSIHTLGGYQVLKFVGKGGVPAAPPMPIPVLRAVLPLTALRDSGPLLRTQAGTRLDRRSMGRLVARIGSRAGISHSITPHGLRRTFATAGFAKGVSLRDMQLGLRHARPESTSVYDMDQGALDRNAAHSVAAFLSGLSA